MQSLQVLLKQQPPSLKVLANEFLLLPYSIHLKGIIHIVIIIIIIISFMLGIYTYIPETNHVPREDIVAAILLLLFMVPISLVPALAVLYFYFNTFRSMCAVPNMAVFCSSLTSWCIITIIIIISFMQGIYTYIPEINNDPREYIVAAILL
jgi:magnesium-transporting ATPase (P-type)